MPHAQKIRQFPATVLVGTRAMFDSGAFDDSPYGSIIILTDTGERFHGQPGGAPTPVATGVKDNLGASAAPTAANDGSQGYAVGSRWIDVTNDESYICVDATQGAAVWSLTTVGTIGEVAGLQAILDAKFPYILVPGATDLNTIVATGVYKANTQASPVNAPLASFGWTVEVQARDPNGTTSGRIVQTYLIGLGAASTGTDIHIYMRSTGDGGANWSPWERINQKAELIHNHFIGQVINLQPALDAKAPLASPAFTGTVTGITKAMVGLGSVDDTADTAKPVSTAQQTALDGKQAVLVSGTNIKTVNGGTLLGSGDLAVGGFVAGSIWTPAQLAGIVGWWPSGRLERYADAAGVSLWPDESGYGASAVQATATAQPDVTFANDQNGERVADFDGDDVLVATARAVHYGITDHLILGVVRPTVDGLDDVASDGSATDGGWLLMGVASGTAGSIKTRAHAWLGSTSNAVDSAQNMLLNAYHLMGQQVVGSTISALADGRKTDLAMSGTAGAGLPTNVRIGGRATALLNGRIAELIIIHASVSDANRQRLDGYLAHKFGIESVLDTAHPYATSPPRN